MNTNTDTGTRAAALGAAALLIASLAACGGTAPTVDISSEQRSLTDVAERRLALQPSSRTDVAERRLSLGESSADAVRSVAAPRAQARTATDVAERRLWMRAAIDTPVRVPDVAERRLWITH